MIRLKTKTKQNVLTVSEGYIDKYLYAEGLTPSISTNFSGFVFQTIYYHEKIIVVDGIEEVVKNVIKSVTEEIPFQNFTNKKGEQSLGIDALFNNFGVAIEKTDSFKGKLIENFKSIYEGFIRNGNIFNLLSENWEVAE